jgi:DNA-binding transcriptional ArsR family regulator
MGGPDDPFDGLDPAEAFDVLGDETRLDILRALADRVRERPEEPAMTFSELRERAGVRDSGLFNHHLDRLLGVFVRQTDGRYVLRHAGRSVVARPFGDDGPAVETTDADCPVCGESDCSRSFHVHLRPPWA